MRIARVCHNQSIPRTLFHGARSSRPESQTTTGFFSSQSPIRCYTVAPQADLILNIVLLNSNKSQNIAKTIPSIRSIVTITKTSSSDDSISLSQKSSTEKTSTPTNPIVTQTSNETHKFMITPACTKRIHQIANNKKIPPSSLYLRVYVDAGGCSGFQYQFEVLTHNEEPVDPEEDVVFAVGESSVVVDKDSLEMMQGATVDYVNEMIRSGFQIVDNPLSETACGCGSSFAVKNFEANR